MALDYVKSLRDMEGNAGEALQPRVKISAEQASAQEGAAREADRENGRYGRFRDQAGNWATAWQAPGRRTPIVPPKFIEPHGKLKRQPTGELILVAEGGDAMVPAQAWVVRYDNDDAVIVAEDEQFRAVMTPEAKVQQPVYANEPEEEAQATAAPEYQRSAGPVHSAASIPQPNNSTSLSVDGFVAQVLQDNLRLRIDLAAAQRVAGDNEQDWRRAEKAATTWQHEHERLAGRMHWLWHHLSQAMGYAPDSRGPLDHEVEGFLARYSRIEREHAEHQAGNGQDPPDAERPSAEAAAVAHDPSPEADVKPPPSLNGKPKRSPIRMPGNEVK